MENEILNGIYDKKYMIKNSNIYELYYAENINDKSKCFIKKYFSYANTYKELYEIINNINNEHILSSIDIFTIDDCVYIVQECISGKYFKSLVNNSTPINLLLRWALEIADIMKSFEDVGIHNITLSLDDIVVSNENSIIIMGFDVLSSFEIKSAFEDSINLIGKIISLNKDYTHFKEISVIVQKCLNQQYEDYSQLFNELYFSMNNKKRIDNLNLSSKLVIIALFLFISLKIGYMAIDGNILFLIISLILIFICIIILLSIDNSNILKYDNHKFNIMKSIVIINTDDAI